MMKEESAWGHVVLGWAPLHPPLEASDTPEPCIRRITWLALRGKLTDSLSDKDEVLATFSSAGWVCGKRVRLPLLHPFWTPDQPV